MLSVGDFGFAVNEPTVMSDFTASYRNELYKCAGTATSLANPNSNYVCQSYHYNSTNRVITGFRLGGQISFYARGMVGGNWLPPIEFYSTANTTKASDGTLKAASPVARIVKSKEESQRSDVAEEGYNWCGCGTANTEAEGIKIFRLDVGVYVLTGSAGLASDGWQLLPPMDPGGMGELGVVEAEQTENGGLTIRLFKRKYLLGDDGEIVKTKGEPMDVPANSWIDVRLDMPDDSIWNTRSSEASLELTEQPAVIQP
ncbi:TPA: hypothetical protein ACOEL2_001992 [Enterobacter hormaechei subsp. xiangfangensis]